MQKNWIIHHISAGTHKKCRKGKDGTKEGAFGFTTARILGIIPIIWVNTQFGAEVPGGRDRAGKKKEQSMEVTILHSLQFNS